MFLEDNHTLHPAQVQNPTDDVRNVVKSMRALGITTFQICEFVMGNHGIALTPTEVDTATIDVDPEITLAESEALIKFLVDTSGTGKTYFVHSGSTEICVACFSQTLEEQRAQLEFGDVIIIDGTSVDNRLHWDIFPMTVIDRNRRILCGGFFFLGLQTSDVFLWMLRRIYAIAGDRWVTLLTTMGEDSTMMIAVPQFLEETCANIRHYLCVFHKFKNFPKHINQMTLPQPTKLSLLNFA
jgi:hypothetical protein